MSRSTHDRSAHDGHKPGLGLDVLLIRRRMRRTTLAGVLAMLCIAALGADQAAAGLNTTFSNTNDRLTVTSTPERSYTFDISCKNNVVFVGGEQAPNSPRARGVGRPPVPCDGVLYIEVDMASGKKAGHRERDIVQLWHLRQEVFRRLIGATVRLGGGKDAAFGVRFAAPFEHADVPVIIFGGPDGDLIHGGTDWDWFFGEEGNDRIEIGNGHDIPHPTLRGIYGAGNDLIHGGDGDDTLGVNTTADVGVDHFSPGCGKDRIKAIDGANPDTILRNAGDTLTKNSNDIVQNEWCLADELLAPPRTVLLTSLGISGTRMTPQKFKASLTSPLPTPTPGPTPGPTPSPTPGRPQCSDGVDNDGDGYIDFDGPGSSEPDGQCESAGDNSEAQSTTGTRTAQGGGGAALSFDLSEPASQVRIEIFRMLDGVTKRPNRRPCRPATRSRLRSLRRSLARSLSGKRLRRGLRARRCSRPSGAGTVVQGALPAGPSVVPFPGSVNGKLLQPGDYVAKLTAVDLAGRRSAPALAWFTISK